MKPIVPIRASGKVARYNIPPFNPRALLSSSPAAVLVHIAQPCAYTAGAVIVSIITISSLFIR
jgi:hypothetical protein